MTSRVPQVFRWCLPQSKKRSLHLPPPLPPQLSHQSAKKPERRSISNMCLAQMRSHWVSTCFIMVADIDKSDALSAGHPWYFYLLGADRRCVRIGGLFCSGVQSEDMKGAPESKPAVNTLRHKGGTTRDAVGSNPLFLNVFTSALVSCLVPHLCVCTCAGSL